jgi:hypothetical protein
VTGPQNRLEELLERATYDAAAREGFYPELLRSQLFVAGTIDAVLPSRVGDEEVIAAFTSPERIEEATEGRLPYVGLPATVVLRRRPRGMKVVLNPGVWHGKELLPDEIAGLISETSVSPGEEVMLGHATERPAALIGLLRTHLRARGDVERARIGHMFLPSSGDPPHPVVGIATRHDTPLEDVLGDLGAVVAEGYDGTVDFVPLDGHTVGDWLAEEGEDILGPATVRTHNALEEAILLRDAEALLPVLADADVYVPTDGDGVAASSLEQLARLRPGGGDYVALTGRALAVGRPGALVLNPGSDLALALTAEQVERLRDLPPGGESELLVGEPREEPTEVLAALRRFAAARDDVRAAYRALLVRRPGSDAEPVVGLELVDGADTASVIEAAAEAARDAGIDRLALVPVGDGGPVARFLLEQTQPFWRRDD